MQKILAILLIFTAGLNYSSKNNEELKGQQGLSFYCEYSVFKVINNAKTLKTSAYLDNMLQASDRQFKYNEYSSNPKLAKLAVIGSNTRDAEVVLDQFLREEEDRASEHAEEAKIVEREDDELVARKLVRARKLGSIYSDMDRYSYQIEMSCGMNELKTIYIISEGLVCSGWTQFFRITLLLDDKIIEKRQSLHSLKKKNNYKLSSKFEFGKRLDLQRLPYVTKNSEECEFIFEGIAIWRIGFWIPLVLSIIFYFG